jgi:Zn-dependent peptidase ImmA (M78 family)
MALVKARYGLIERLTEQLLSEFAGPSPPVPVERIATAKGCVIRQSDLKEISGILVRTPSGSVIGVNRNHPETRRRFTIAHELGHFLLHEGEGVTYDEDFRVSLRSDQSSTGTQVAEIEANFFAASLLMPNRLLLADLRTSTIELEDSDATSDLARAFGVSTQAMTLRLARLVDRQGRSALSGRQARFF